MSIGLLTTLWVVYGFNELISIDLRQFGVRPLSINGLSGIFFYPFLHNDLGHISGNSVPAWFLTFLLFNNYREIAWKVLIWGWLMSGFWLWIAAQPVSNHIGFSGIIYVEAAFIFFSGLFRKYYRLMALSLIIVFLYGYMIWYVMPLVPNMSWQGHLFGLIAGFILAIYLREEGPQRPPYSWELEPEEEEELVS